jgi:hypothetical protein
MHGELTGVIDEIAPDSYANAVQVGFLGTKIYHHTGVCYHTVFGDSCNFVVSHDNNEICTLLTSFVVLLRHSSKIFTKGR